MRYTLLDAEHLLRQIAIDRRHRAFPPSHSGWDDDGKMPHMGPPSDHSTTLIALSRGIVQSALEVIDAYYCGWTDPLTGNVGTLDRHRGAGIWMVSEELPDGYSCWPDYEKGTGDERHQRVKHTTEQQCMAPDVIVVADLFSATVRDVKRLLKQAREAVCLNLERRIEAEAEAEEGE